MAISASVINGQVVAGSTPDNTTTSTVGTSTLGKDQFLQILVAEMQYQDPLEPTSNTEWVSQMATFSQIEELQNMSSSMETGQAQDLVGKIVIVSTTDTSGEQQFITGEVESLEIKEDGTYFSINGYLYKTEELYAVVDEDYYNKIMESGSTDSTGGEDA